MPPRKRGKARKPRRGQDVAPGQPNDLNAASRAQLGPDEEARPYRPPEYDASMEDPLHDWPEEDR
jgi:hypothetical protein